MTPVELVLSKLPGVKRSGKEWMAPCPAHDDKHPSLSVREGDDGKALVHCHAGCSPEKIVAAMGLTLADLMPEAMPKPMPKCAPKPTAKAGRVFATANDAVASLERELGPRAAMWTYQSANGDPVGVVVRWDTHAGKTIRPVSKTPGGWIIGAMPDPRPLYHLPDLLARTDEVVYICEGEKAADAAAGLGLLATTSPHGSHSAAKADWTALAGREVVIIPDHDEAGVKYAGEVVGILAKLTPAATVRIVNLVDGWSDLPPGGDLADVVSGEDAETIKAKLAGLVEKAAPQQIGPIVVCMAHVIAREIEWLWPGRIPSGRITLLVGRPGEGKSFLTCDMAARVSTGRPWPDGRECPSGSVILISAEDDPADTIRPRLDAHGAAVEKVHLLSAVRHLGVDGRPREVLFTLEDLDALESVLRMLPDPRLIVVDPVGSFLGGDTDAHRDNEVRSVLTPIGQLAERYDVAVLLVAHRRKSTGNFADDLALGSRAFTGIARAVWHLSHDVHDIDRRLLLPGKNNLAAKGDGLGFFIAGNPPMIVWEPDPVRMIADDALAQENNHQSKSEALLQASDWLAGELGDLEKHPVKDLKAAAEAAGLTWRTVQRASQRLGVKVCRDGFGGQCVWCLPRPAYTPTTTEEPGTYGHSCHSREIFVGENGKYESLLGKSLI